MLQLLLNAPRHTKRAIALTYDAFAIPFAIYAAIALRHGTIMPPHSTELYISAVITLGISLGVFTRLGLYRAVVRFMTEKAFTALALGISISALTLGAASYLAKADIPRSSIIIYFFTAFAILGAPRLFIRSLIAQLQKNNNKERVVIYGAGLQGVALNNALQNNPQFKPVAFIDDDVKKIGTYIQGLKVISKQELYLLIDSKSINRVLLALGRSTKAERKQLIDELSDKDIEVLTTPSVQDIVSGKAKVDEIKEVEIEDLLGRDCVAPNRDLLANDIQGKNVLITGAGGSIGSEISRQVLLQKPKKIVLLELNEFSLYSIEQELTQLKNNNNLECEIIPILGSVQKQHRLETIFRTFNIHTIYHAAAYKHVPMVEHNVVEGVRNNVFGTWFCAEAAILAGVEKFVLISTDKAVRPTNVMGASKRLAELVLQALSLRQQQTSFSMVRFGNVLGSSGSVVPLFRKQISEGGPITVTHPDIIRYFMTIPEASQLVIQAGAMGKGGDVFVLDMGEPVKITHLAKKMIRLSGLTEKTEKNPNGDISIKFTGLRPGEKLYEELLIGENVEGTEHPRIMTANEVHLSWPETHNLLNRLDKACHDFDVEKVINLLLEAPAAYNKQDTSPDWVLNAGK